MGVVTSPGTTITIQGANGERVPIDSLPSSVLFGGTIKVDRNGFDEILAAIAKPDYLAAFKKLPGSTRTKRLRKKRRDAIVRWWNR